MKQNTLKQENHHPIETTEWSNLRSFQAYANEYEEPLPTDIYSEDGVTAIVERNSKKPYAPMRIGNMVLVKIKRSRKKPYWEVAAVDPTTNQYPFDNKFIGLRVWAFDNFVSAKNSFTQRTNALLAS